MWPDPDEFRGCVADRRLYVRQHGDFLRPHGAFLRPWVVVPATHPTGWNWSRPVSGDTESAVLQALRDQAQAEHAQDLERLERCRAAAHGIDAELLEFSRTTAPAEFEWAAHQAGMRVVVRRVVQEDDRGRFAGWTGEIEARISPEIYRGPGRRRPVRGEAVGPDRQAAVRAAIAAVDFYDSWRRP